MPANRQQACLSLLSVPHTVCAEMHACVHQIPQSARVQHESMRAWLAVCLTIYLMYHSLALCISHTENASSSRLAVSKVKLFAITHALKHSFDLSKTRKLVLFGVSLEGLSFFVLVKGMWKLGPSWENEKLSLICAENVLNLSSILYRSMLTEVYFLNGADLDTLTML